MSNPESKKRYLTAGQLRERYGGRSHMWIERRLQDDPTFPKPTKFGRLRFWDEAALEKWERSHAAEAAHG
jgi:predicted DNA-binding transcriptional regulator AlpA